ncbi:MAG: hypothetical protein C4562_05235 [Actinobacteria bacterium]|nr:MAG: hypothetical protein C4562_05235 [Actinomycetota bacterium]
MKHKQIISIVFAVTLVAVGVGAFFGGVYYQSSKSPASAFAAMRNAGGFPGGGPGGGQMMRRFGQNGSSNAGDFATGEITAKDEESITVKTRDGGSKIVYYSKSTAVNKMVKGNDSDLTKGKQVMVSGKSSAEGSLTAKNIQIRPNDAN